MELGGPGRDRGPALLVAPLAALVQAAVLCLPAVAAPHDEVLRRRPHVGALVALQPAVEPAEFEVQVVVVGDDPGALRPEVHVSDRRGEVVVRPRADEDVLVLPPHAHHRLVSVADRARVPVEPAHDPENRHVRVRLEVLVHAQSRLPPEVAVVVVVEVELEGGLLVGRRQAERRLSAPPRDARGPVEEGLPGPHLVDRLGDLRVRPRLVPVRRDGQNPLQQPQTQGAAALHAVGVGVRRSLVGDHRLEAGRVQRRGLELDPRLVRHAVRPHLAVAGGVPGDPLDRVVAVLRLLHEGEEVAPRVEAPPTVLDDGDVPVAREEHRVVDGDRAHLVVRSPREDGGERLLQRDAVHGRQVEIRHEVEAVPHGDRHVLHDDDIPVRLRGEPAAGCLVASGQPLRVERGAESGHPRSRQSGSNERSAVHEASSGGCTRGCPRRKSTIPNLRTSTTASRRGMRRGTGSRTPVPCHGKRPRRTLEAR